MAQSGNRPPRNSGNRPPRSERAPSGAPPKAPSSAPNESASDRARERLAQQGASSSKSKSAAQRARAGSPSGRHPGKGRTQRSTAMTAGIFGSVLVVLVIVVIVLVSVLGKSTTSSKNSTYFPSQPAPASVTTPLVNVPTAALAAAGTGGGTVSATGVIHALTGQPADNVGSKPQLVYLGAEYCPYCGATRWPLVVALSRFGKFSNLQITKSSAYDYAPSTDTLSFYGSTYSSPYLVFNATEETTNQCAVAIVNNLCNSYKPLQAPTPFVTALAQKYDRPPYVSANQLSGIPFLYFGGRYVESGAIYLPTALAGLTWQQIAASTANPISASGQPILGAANIYTAAICKMTNGQPGSVCNSPVIQQAAKALP